jgi:hypothetical protein
MTTIECPGCEGTGDCTECNGVNSDRCWACTGTGDCPECDGEGQVEEDEPEPPEPYYAEPPTWS